MRVLRCSPLQSQHESWSWPFAGKRACRSNAAAHAAFSPHRHGHAHAIGSAPGPDDPCLQTTLSTSTAAEQSLIGGVADDALACVCFTVIIDDIVFPDGRTLMGALGGGGAHLHVQHLVRVDAFKTPSHQVQNCVPVEFPRCAPSGAQSLFGYQLYHEQRARVGLAAGIGIDFPPACTVCANCAAGNCLKLSITRW